MTRLKHFSATKKIYSLLFLLLLFVCLPTTCSAAEITAEEVQQLASNLDQLSINNSQQLTALAQAKQSLQTASAQLIQSQQELATLKAQLITLQQQLAIARSEQQTALQSLQTANALFTTYNKEVKQEQTKLKIERDLSIIAAVFFAVRK